MIIVFMVFLGGCSSTGKKLAKPEAPDSRIGSPEFGQAMGAVLGPRFVGGNRIDTLENGDEIFPAMLKAIGSARRTITFETYVFEEGAIPERFSVALAERARAGVKVHLILDAHGASKAKKYRKTWQDAGVDVVMFKSPWTHLLRYNNRTHRKLLIVDGQVAFTGGVGIADEWAGNANSPEEWHDTHYRIQGPAVADLQGVFMEHWLKSRGDLLHGPDYFPHLPARGALHMAGFHSSPESGSRNVEIMLNLAIASARKSLLIENAYFVPDKKTINALVAAARRGVLVRVILPGKYIDSKAVRRASRIRWGPLLEAGVEIYEYQPTMPHAKLLIADGLFVSVGSANLDYRSLRINAEANVNVLDAAFAAEQTRLFERDRAKSTRVTEESWRKTRVGDTLMQAVQAPMDPLL